MYHTAVEKTTLEIFWLEIKWHSLLLSDGFTFLKNAPEEKMERMAGRCRLTRLVRPKKPEKCLKVKEQNKKRFGHD